MSRGFWVFRGHRDASWRLETTLERSAQTWKWFVDRRERERYFIWLFQSRAHQYLQNAPPPTQQLEWLTLMQHFGAPTRLLDVTASFYVAVYFAIDQAYGNAAVWAFNTAILAENNEERRPRTYPLPEHVVELILRQNSLAEECLTEREESMPGGVVQVTPAWQNERLSIQQGSFLFPFRLRMPFATNLAHAFDDDWKAFAQELADLDSARATPDETISSTTRLAKIILPQSEHEVIWADLAQMNISSASLFPDLAGFARSFQRRLPNKPPDG
jgi:hypothetical protein